MSKFLAGKDLYDAVYDIIWFSEHELMIVSPYIKLDEYFKKLFDNHENNPKLHLILVFGKNEKDVQRSMNREDFEYFKKFLKVSIIYVPNLHAKYYGNEKKGLITSINLYDYSFKHNIEFGMLSKRPSSKSRNNGTNDEAWQKCIEIAKSNEVVFIKRPVYESKKFIFNYSKTYVKSNVLHDSTEKFYKAFFAKKYKQRQLDEFPDELELGSFNSERPIRKEDETELSGFCIRSGIKIPFNPASPMSLESWKVWNEYQNMDFPENYCHRTGKRSFGKTSMRNPTL